jgi:ferredoxin-nitrate reductase
MFKGGAVRIEKISDEKDGEIVIHAQEGQTSTLEEVSRRKATAQDIHDNDERERHLEYWIGATYEAIKVLISITETLQKLHHKDHEFESGMSVLRKIAKAMLEKMDPIVAKYGENKKFGEDVLIRLRDSIFAHQLNGISSYEVLVAMQGLYMYNSHLESHFLALTPASEAMWDGEFIAAVTDCQKEVGRMQSWVNAQIKVRSPQTLLVPSSFLGIQLPSDKKISEKVEKIEKDPQAVKENGQVNGGVKGDVKNRVNGVNGHGDGEVSGKANGKTKGRS